MKKINVAIVGVGNCAKSFVEGIGYYTKNKDDTVGLMHPVIGKYHPRDINFVAAFDIDERKVGKKLHEAISQEPNKTIKIDEPLQYGLTVQRGITAGSVIKELREHFIHESNLVEVDVTQVLRSVKADIVVNYLPSGSDQATYAYAQASLEAGCSFINCMPTPIAKDSEWQKKFCDAGLVLVGDDVKSQVGATILNRTILNLLKIRGVKILKSEQINYGGNADHFNLSFRPKSKEESKQAALKSMLSDDDARPTARMIYTEKNYDHKKAIMKIEGEIFGHIPVSLKIELDDEDSPNDAGVVVDAVRLVKLLLDQERQNESNIVSAYLFKAPPDQLLNEFEALNELNKIINQE